MSHHTHDPVCPLCVEKLHDADPALHDIYLQVKAEFPDAHISWTFRDEANQNQFFQDGKTRCRWPNSKHNRKPSRAMDLFQLRPDNVAAWPAPWFRSIADFLTSIGAPIQWGGHWKTIGDGDHYELKA